MPLFTAPSAVQPTQISTQVVSLLGYFENINAQANVIPIYQRQYDWTKSHIDRLMHDCVSLIREIGKDAQSSRYLGTFLVYYPQPGIPRDWGTPNNAPPVALIVDGQQRISTAVIFAIVLDKLAKEIRQKIRNYPPSEELIAGLRDEVDYALQSLSNSAARVLQFEAGDQYRPKILRQRYDRWGKAQNDPHYVTASTENRARYVSPLANLLFHYIQHRSANQPAQNFSFAVPVPHQSPLNTQLYHHIESIASHVEARLREVAAGGDIARTGEDAYHFPQLTEIFTDWNLFPNPSNLEAALQAAAPELKENLRAGIHCSLFFNALFQRNLVILVSTPNEEQAIGSFEALNSTGEPLTPIQTFLPSVIAATDADTYDNSSFVGPMDVVTHYVDGQRAANRQKKSSELVIAFALAEKGEQLTGHLADQRRFLRGFGDLSTVEAKLRYVKDLSHLASMMEQAWLKPNELPAHGPLSLQAQADHATHFAFQGLRALNHTITVPLLARFYGASLQGNLLPEDLGAVVRAVAAFSMLWRAANRNTAGIDDEYRELMGSGQPVGRPEQFLVFNRTSRPNVGPGCVELLKSELRRRLIEQFGIGEHKTLESARARWLELVQLNPLFQASSVVAKFILICGLHETTLDPSGNLVRSFPGGGYRAIQSNAWNSREFATVEHIAPQSCPAEWRIAGFADSADTHYLGNLVLLPKEGNWFASNRSWEFKRLLYSALSATNQQARMQVLQANPQQSADLTQATTRYLGNAASLPACELIPRVQSWTPAVVRQRSLHLGQFAWDRLMSWL